MLFYGVYARKEHVYFIANSCVYNMLNLESKNGTSFNKVLYNSINAHNAYNAFALFFSLSFSVSLCAGE